MEKRNLYIALKVFVNILIVLIVIGTITAAIRTVYMHSYKNGTVETVVETNHPEDTGKNTIYNLFIYESNKIVPNEKNTVYVGRDLYPIVLNKTTVAELINNTDYEVEYKNSEYDYSDYYAFDGNDGVTKDTFENIKTTGISMNGSLFLRLIEPSQKNDIIILGHSFENVDLYDLDFSKVYIYGITLDHKLTDTKYNYKYCNITQLSTENEIIDALKDFELDNSFEDNDEYTRSVSLYYSLDSLDVDYYEWQDKDDVYYCSRNLTIRQNELEPTSSWEEFDAR